MDTDFDARGPATESISSFVLSTFFKRDHLLPRKDHHSLPCDEIHQLPPCQKAHSFPVEIFSEIFLYTVQADPRSRANLMLVCWHWHDIMLLTPGVHSQLRIHKRTKKEDIERFGRRWLLDVTVDIQDITVEDWRHEQDLNPVEFYACFMAAAEAASRWRSLVLVSFPPPGEYKDLQIMHPLKHLESFKLAESCHLGSFLKPLMTTITTTVTPLFTVMELFHPDAALYIVQLAHFQLFSFLTTLRLVCKRMQNPVNILPSLHKLEIFEAHYLSLPIYPPDVDLPLTETLRVLHLKSVSVQWIEGRVFPVLEECSIIFPHNTDAVRSVYMPSCSILKYDSNNLGALEYFHIPQLNRLEIKCGQWRTWRGTLQLIAVHPIFAAQSLTCLHLQIKCSEGLLAHMLRLVPALEELWMGLSSPHALSSAFFMAFAAGGCNAIAGPSNQIIEPLCRRLRMLHLQYKRWSRGTERNALIQAFGAIVASHPPEEKMFSLRHSFGEGPDSQEWIIHEPVERFPIELESDRTVVGVSSPHGIVPLSRASVNNYLHPLTELEFLSLPRESEYLTTHEFLQLPIDYFFSLHNLKEVRMYSLHLENGPIAQFSPNVPLFHTLEVLAVRSAPSSFFAGYTFHKLERYSEKYNLCMDIPGQDLLTEMPICTRLVARLSRLATLKLPKICELVVLNDHDEPEYLWEKHIAVNANLSGLKLLGLYIGDHKWLPVNYITKILELLPALETLVLEGQYLVDPFVTCVKALTPMNAQETPGLNRSNWEEQMSKVLCPRLETLQIEGISLTERPELIPVLENIVTLRASIGLPLKSFTFYHWHPKKKWELIGRNSGFIMEEVVPTKIFQLDI